MSGRRCARSPLASARSFYVAIWCIVCIVHTRRCCTWYTWYTYLSRRYCHGSRDIHCMQESRNFPAGFIRLAPLVPSLARGIRLSTSVRSYFHKLTPPFSLAYAVREKLRVGKRARALPTPSSKFSLPRTVSHLGAIII